MDSFVLLSFFLLVLAHCCSSAGCETKITYKATANYVLTWNDKGSRARKDVSIWAVKNDQADHCSLGDVAVEGWRKPSSKTLLLRAVGCEALASPTGFSQVWSDRGSGANWDVAIYNMICPAGYSSLGSVAVRSWRAKPSKSQYCCVKNTYLTSGKYEKSWDDKGSRADSEVGLWKVIRGSDQNAMEGGNFIAFASWRFPRYLTPKLLKADKLTGGV